MEPPHARIRSSPAIQIFIQTREGAVVNHLSLLVAPAAIDHPAHCHSIYVARNHAIYELCRVSSADPVLEQRRHVNHRSGVADRVVLVLVVRFIDARGVVSGAFAKVQALAQAKGILVNGGSNWHGSPPDSVKPGTGASRV